MLKVLCCMTAETLTVDRRSVGDMTLSMVQAALRGAQFRGGPFDENHGAYFPPEPVTFLAEAASPFNSLV